MSTINLTSEQKEVLKEVLTSYLSDLRYEIANTDAQDFRERLKRKKVVINEVLTLLG